MGRLLGGPELLDTCVEELIRFDAPLQIFERTATAEVKIAGFRVADGERIGALLGAAARDPKVFDDPDTLDIGRTPRRRNNSRAPGSARVARTLARGAACRALRRELVTTATGSARRPLQGERRL